MKMIWNLGRTAIIALVVGLLLGLGLGLLIGWVIAPAQYEPSGRSYDLKADEKAAYVALVADSYALNRNEQAARARFDRWYAPELEQAFASAIAQAEAEAQPARAQYIRELQALLQVAQVTPEPTPPEAPAKPSIFGQILRFCGLFLLVLLVVVLGYVGLQMALRRRKAAEKPARRPERAPILPRPEEWEGTGQPPLGHFITTYRLGEDSYDESFSIETPLGEFLGECGVGISEVIGVGDPDKVTAFEVWLFDKTDIRTVTKVLMSDYAFQDEALRGKLAPKGEPVLAAVGRPFALETSGLQVQIAVTELEYGEGGLPTKSFFEKLTVELVALARSKEESLY